jgi:hypothetical protein
LRHGSLNSLFQVAWYLPCSLHLEQSGAVLNSLGQSRIVLYCLWEDETRNLKPSRRRRGAISRGREHSRASWTCWLRSCNASPPCSESPSRTVARRLEQSRTVSNRLESSREYSRASWTCWFRSSSASPPCSESSSRTVVCRLGQSTTVSNCLELSLGGRNPKPKTQTKKVPDGREGHGRDAASGYCRIRSGNEPEP